ncbi:MAG: pentapeptide repeat-containing protein [Bacteroidales bacterium]|nr:pentapeptide repeat-containing protein [Bacteroidales bacterium]
METKMIGNKIAEARKKLNVSQAQLAENLFISPQAVGKWERGESMPDITTLIRLAKVLGVDLNYFSEDFQSINPDTEINTDTVEQHPKIQQPKWDMSAGNWANADFSGLKNLHEKFSASNMQNCKFIGSEMSGLLLRSNNIDGCDFSSSDFAGSKIKNSYLSKNEFKDCALNETEFSESYFSGCNFKGANFTNAILKSGGFEKSIMTNAILNHTTFVAIYFTDIVFEGTIENCHFENCTFKTVTFQNTIIRNTFFKYNRKINRVTFINCKADNLSYAFLKNDKADLTGVTLITS